MAWDTKLEEPTVFMRDVLAGFELAPAPNDFCPHSLDLPGAGTPAEKPIPALACRALVEIMAEGAAVLNPTGVVLWCNSSFAGLVNRPPHSISGKCVDEFFDGEDRNGCRSLVRHCIRSGRGRSLEMMLSAGGGKKVPVKLDADLFSDCGRTYVNLLATDLSEHKARDADLRRFREELLLKKEELRRLALELGHAEQRERARLAQVLHDGLQQLLVAAKMQVNTLMSRPVDDATRVACRKIDELIDESLAASRSLTAELNPPILKDGGLVAALEWLARRFGSQHGLRISVDADDASCPVREDIRVLLFQSVRELLFNVVKHAGVKEARIEVRHLAERHLAVAVTDHGRGCKGTDGVDPAGLEHFGLRTLSERIKLAGGRLALFSGQNLGTRVVLLVPMLVGAATPALA